MSVLVISITDPVFEKKSAEIQYLLRVIDLLKNELGRSRGTVTSGTVVGTSAAGVPNASLGSWIYTPSGSIP